MMIVSWMLYASVVGILVGAAAVSAERVFRDHHLPTRWIWCASLLATLAVPALIRFVPEPIAEATAAPAAEIEVATPSVGALQQTWRAVADRAAAWLAPVEDLIVRGWWVISALLFVIVGISVARLRAARAAWREDSLDGTPVLVSDDVGPAVWGVFDQRIVVPAWVITRSPEARDMILSHEREHVRARDPLLVIASALPSLFVPWHMPLWWQYRRLRLAVEMDCDERVLKAASSSVRRRYGHLLLEVSRRKSGMLALAAPFSERRSFLGRRIRGLAEAPPKHPVHRDAFLSAVGFALIAAIWSLPRPAVPARAPELQAELPGISARDALPGLRELPLIGSGPAAPAVDALQQPTEPASTGAALVASAALAGQLASTDESAEVVAASELTATEVLDLEPEADVVLDVTASLDEPAPPGPQPMVRPTLPELAPLLLPDPIAATDLTHVLTVNAPTAREIRLATADPTVKPQVLNVDEIQKQMQRRYPPHLLDAGVGGTVVLDFFVDESGTPTEWSIAQSSGHQILDDAALRMASTFRFSPARRRDQVVPTWARFPIRFQVLEQGRR
jgi:TonB family protein